MYLKRMRCDRKRTFFKARDGNMYEKDARTKSDELRV